MSNELLARRYRRKRDAAPPPVTARVTARAISARIMLPQGMLRPASGGPSARPFFSAKAEARAVTSA